MPQPVLQPSSIPKATLSHSQSQQPLRTRRGSQRHISQPRDHVRQTVSAVDAILELRQVALCIFRTHRLIRASHCGLDIAKDGVHPAKLDPLNAGLAPAGDHRGMLTPGLAHRLEASQPIRHNLSALTKVLLCPLRQLSVSEPFDNAQLHAQRMTFLIGLHGCHKGRLASRTASALAAAALTAQIGIVKLHQPLQLVFTVALHHHLHQLVLHTPGGVVGDAQVAAQLHGRDAFLALRQQEDGLKPQRQRQFGGIEDGAGGDGGLAVAAIALSQLTHRELAGLVMTAMRTLKAVWPAPLEQGIEALLFGAVEFQELFKADAFLKLDLVARHNNSPINNRLQILVLYNDLGFGIIVIRKTYNIFRYHNKIEFILY